MSARLRLTLIFAGMFLGLGTAVVLVVFALVHAGTAVSIAAQPGAGGTVLHAVTQQHSIDQARLEAVSWLTLAFTAVASLPLGWFVAGRVLRPLRGMTESARTISAGNLHERLALSGPNDEFKQLGDTIDDLLARLEAAFAAQRRFVANAAHELRTPLTLERTLLQVALADPEATEASLRATCGELLESGRNQERLLEGLLTLATGERGLEQRQRVDLAPLAERSLTALTAEIERARLSATARLTPAQVLGDPALMERLIANLLDNAVRYNRSGGRIELQTETTSDRAILRVVNSGPTIPAQEVGRLFEPFQRLEAQRIAGEGHYGLGLSIARAIATAHDATISAEPNLEGGLTVTVSFPRGDEGTITPPRAGAVANPLDVA